MALKFKVSDNGGDNRVSQAVTLNWFISNYTILRRTVIITWFESDHLGSSNRTLEFCVNHCFQILC